MVIIVRKMLLVLALDGQEIVGWRCTRSYVKSPTFAAPEAPTSLWRFHGWLDESHCQAKVLSRNWAEIAEMTENRSLTCSCPVPLL